MPQDWIIAATLGGFIILAGASIVWTTIRTGISPMPSSPQARRVMLDLAAPLNPTVIYELGSGFGTLALPLARKFPDAQVIAYELSFVPWLISRIRVRLAKLPNLSIRRSDFLAADLREANLLICYLYPGAMSELSEKLEQEPSHATLITHTFALRGHEPTATQQVRDLYRSPVYLYDLKATQKPV